MEPHQLSRPTYQQTTPDNLEFAMPLAIARIDTRQAGSAEQIELLRKKLAPTGDVVSEAGRKKTIEVFGVPLAPAEVVERVCSDVRTRGLESVLDYTHKFDKVKL